MKNKILLKLNKELKNYVDPTYKIGAERYFKESMTCYGVRTPVVRKIAKKYWQLISPPLQGGGKGEVDKKEIFILCEELLKTDKMEDSTIAFAWARNLENQFEEKDFKTFENWVKKYVNNWAKCDDFCTHAVGAIIIKYPKFLEELKKWRKSKNVWVRRASAVTLIGPMIRKKSKFLPNIFKTADELLLDKEDMVQKGYGWMLKVASNNHPAEVFKYVLKHKHIMPRTALRYAIEKYPREMKKQAMQKD